MTDGTQNCYMEYKPTLRERFWRKMGFRFHLRELEPNDESWQGWMQSRSGIHFDWRDRLRILVSGHLKLQHTYHMDTPTPDKIHTRFDWHIAAPCDNN